MPRKSTLSSEPGFLKCRRCGSACCKYITVKIPAPRSMLDFDNLVWQLCHADVKALKDADGWCLLIYNNCIHLGKNGKCAIYTRRPVTCREHPAVQCEFDDPLPENAELYFDDAASLVEYCRKRFKNWERRYD